MARNQVKRISPDNLTADEAAFIAIEALGNYQPARGAYNKVNLVACRDAMEAARELEVKAENNLKAARDDAVASEWEFHNSILGAKVQVIAQYGDDSNEVQALGLKKKSERKSPGRRKAVVK